MIKEAIITVAIGALIPTGIYLGDSRYITQNMYQQSVNQARIWQLIDQINAIKDEAAYQHRDLTDYEKMRIRQLEVEKAKLETG